MFGCVGIAGRDPSLVTNGPAATVRTAASS